VVRWYAHAVSPLRGGPRTGRATGSVILKPWTRCGTDSFLGQVDLPGGGKNSLLESPIAFDPDDGSARGLISLWLRLVRTKPTPIEKKTGARSQRSRITRVEKGNKKIPTGMSVPLDLPSNRRPLRESRYAMGQKAAVLKLVAASSPLLLDSNRDLST
jgi:hypothetical protein